MSSVLISPQSHEIDYVKSLGVHPYIPGEEIMSFYTVNVGLADIYLVPDNKVLCLSLVSIIIITDADNMTFMVHDTSDNEVFRFLTHISTCFESEVNKNSSSNDIVTLSPKNHSSVSAGYI